jgi:hypothetical protein
MNTKTNCSLIKMYGYSLVYLKRGYCCYKITVEEYFIAICILDIQENNENFLRIHHDHSENNDGHYNGNQYLSLHEHSNY